MVNLYLAVSHIYGSMIHCLVWLKSKMYGKQFWSKHTGIASLLKKLTDTRFKVLKFSLFKRGNQASIDDCWPNVLVTTPEFKV